MSTELKPELSKKNPYYISRYRFYELRNFCLQYADWKATIRSLDGYKCDAKFIVVEKDQPMLGDSIVERAVITREELENRIRLVEKVAEITEPSLAKWLLKGVTVRSSYDYLKTRHNIPCSRDTYYKLYRKFFCVLDKLRG